MHTIYVYVCVYVKTYIYINCMCIDISPQHIPTCPETRALDPEPESLHPTLEEVKGCHGVIETRVAELRSEIEARQV